MSQKLDLNKVQSAAQQQVKDHQSIYQFKAVTETKLSKYQIKKKKTGYTCPEATFQSNVLLSVIFSFELLPFPIPTETSGTQQLPYDYIYTHTFYSIFSFQFSFPIKDTLQIPFSLLSWPSFGFRSLQVSRVNQTVPNKLRKSY